MAKTFQECQGGQKFFSSVCFEDIWDVSKRDTHTQPQLFQLLQTFPSVDVISCDHVGLDWICLGFNLGTLIVRTWKILVETFWNAQFSEFYCLTSGCVFLESRPGQRPRGACPPPPKKECQWGLWRWQCCWAEWQLTTSLLNIPLGLFNKAYTVRPCRRNVTSA